MNSQPNMDGELGAFAAPPIQAQDDYSPEELALIQKVEEENDARKKALYEKQQEEMTEKNTRK